MRGPIRHHPLRTALAGLLAVSLAAAPAAGGIVGEQVVSGEASFEQQGDVTTIHASDGAILHFDELGVGSHEELHFVQPHSQARVLNRVFGDATHIDGGLFANGIVYILNPAGIFFGPEAIVDVGGLHAVAGHISDEAFALGTDQFELTGPVHNAGRIEAASVALLGRSVANHGRIHAPDGTIALVAGERVILTRPGGHLHVEVEGGADASGGAAIVQAGHVDAGRGAAVFHSGDVYSLALNHEGITRARRIELRADGGGVEVSGRLDAGDPGAGATGGSIDVTGARVALLGAVLDASGDAAGGSIRVGGGLRGGGSLPTARRSYVDRDSTLSADAISRGDGGRVIVWADEVTAFHGALSARGGASGGDGGFAEISGALALGASGQVDLGAARGAPGTLLYDPQDIVLMGGLGDGDDDPDASDALLDPAQVLFADAGGLAAPFEVFESELERTDADIVLEATHSITASGTFDHDAAGEGDGVVRLVDGRSLTLRTRNEVDDGLGSALAPGIELAGVSFQTTGGGDVRLETGDGSLHVGGVDTSGADGATGGRAGSIFLVAGDADASGDSHITVDGDLLARGGAGATGSGGAGGAVTVQASGVPVDIGGDIEPVQGGGDIALANIGASGGSGATNGGRGGSVVVDTSDGAIASGSIDATGGDGGSRGGNGGSIDVTTRDADMDGANDVDVPLLGVAGGTGGTGNGGSGGRIDVRSLASLRVVDPDDPTVVIQEPAGGGSVSLGNVFAGGGNGANGGPARGGTDFFGNPLSAVSVRTENGDIAVAAISATGGDGATGSGARGGGVRLRAGDSENGSGDIRVDIRIDAQEGSSAPDLDFVDGGDVSLFAAGDIERGALAGPHVVTGGTVELIAGGDIGAAGRFELEGGGEPGDELRVGTGGRADVRVLNAGFLGRINVVATDPGADIDLSQFGAGGDDVIEMVPGAGGELVVTRVASPVNAVDLQVGLETPDPESPDATLVLETGAVEAGGSFTAHSDGDLVVGTSDGVVIRAGGDAGAAGTIQLSADVDTDGVGGIRDAPGAATGVINLLGDAEDPATLLLLAADGVGESGAPIVTSGGGRVAAFNGPIAPDPENEGAFIPDDDAVSGIFLRNVVNPDVAGGVLTIVRSGVFSNVNGVEVIAGTGDVEITNEVGDIVIEGIVRARQPLDDGTVQGGDVTFTADRIVMDSVLLGGNFVNSGGRQVYDGDVVLIRDVRLTADDGIELRGGLDEDEFADPTVSLIAALGGVSRFEGEIGATRPVFGLELLAAEAAVAPRAVFDAAGVTTSGVQDYAIDVTLARDVRFEAGSRVSFAGGLDAEAGAPSSLATVVSGDVVEFAGDVGGDRPLSGLSVSAPTAISFNGPGDQSVTTLGGGIALNPAGRTGVPPEATLGTLDGGLSLTSLGGSVIVGDREKLSVAGTLTLVGDAVRVTDLSALAIDVQSPDTRIFARESAVVRVADGRLITDGGTDLLANVIGFSSAPQVTGAGPAPRIATASGSAVNPGGLSVARLSTPIVASNIVTSDRVLDLAIPVADPGNETPEFLDGPVEPPQVPWVSDTQAAVDRPSAEQVVAFLSCAPAGSGGPPAGCAAPASAPPASSLDTARAADLAGRYRALLGDGEPARAGRRDLARAAADPGAPLADAAGAAGQRYLLDLARLLAETRMLGLDAAAHGEVRGRLLAAVVAAVDAPALDVDRLAAAVEANAMGMSL